MPERKYPAATILELLATFFMVCAGIGLVVVAVSFVREQDNLFTFLVGISLFITFTLNWAVVRLFCGIARDIRELVIINTFSTARGKN